MGMLGKGLRALQKRRVQRALKPKVSKDYKPTGLRKYTKKKAVEKETARVQAEAKAGAKKAERGSKAKQVEKRVLPDVSKRMVGGDYVPKGRGPGLHIRTQLKKLNGQNKSAKEIAEEFTGKEISAMQRKIKDPSILARLQRARKMREKGHREWETFEKGEKHTPGQKLRFKYQKSGGTVKRNSGGLVGMGAALRGGGAVRKR